MTALFSRFVRDDDGQDLIEYGLLVGIVAAGRDLAIGDRFQGVRGLHRPE